ncbi:MAG: hypothetical protein LUB63_08065 [Oscillospiraceae bacterium]|nr:hypothetical protein [Oscillospiraceae bacterium]
MGSEALEGRAGPTCCQVCLRCLILHGSGASFAGLSYEGFDNLTHTAASAGETA